MPMIKYYYFCKVGSKEESGSFEAPDDFLALMELARRDYICFLFKLSSDENDFPYVILWESEEECNKIHESMREMALLF